MSPMAPPTLRGRQKAAVLLIALGPECSAKVLKQFKDSEIEQLTLEILAMDDVPDEVRTEVLSEGHQMALASRYLSTGGVGYAQEMLTRAMGPQRATEVISRLAANMRPQHFAFLKNSDPAQLAHFIQDEQPQAIALILAHLPAPLASKTLSLLPPELQPEVATRIATMDRTLPEVIEGVETVLQQRLSRVMTGETSAAGGVDTLVRILSNVDRTMERSILEHLDERAADLAAEIRKQMFVFENLLQLDGQSLQRVLRDVDARDLGLALRGAGPDLREHIFKNVSTRAAETLREEIETGGPVRRVHVEEAQQRVVGVARRLEEAGEIVMQRGTDDVLV